MPEDAPSWRDDESWGKYGKVKFDAAVRRGPDETPPQDDSTP
jgi:hypothetical protein